MAGFFARNNHAVLRGVTTTNLKVNMFLTTNLNLLRPCPTNSELHQTGGRRMPNDTLTTPETGKQRNACWNWNRKLLFRITSGKSSHRSFPIPPASLQSRLLHRGIGGGMYTRKAHETREAPRRGQR